MKHLSNLFITSLQIIAAIYSSCAEATAQLSDRQKISISNDWRFTKGDPSDARDLSYDFRPLPPQKLDTDSDQLTDSTQIHNITKAWILPSGNDFTSSVKKGGTL